MTLQENNEILQEDFNLIPDATSQNPDINKGYKEDDVHFWRHKNIPNIWAMCKKYNSPSQYEIIFLRADNLKEVGLNIKYGVKLAYSLEVQLMDLIVAIRE